MSIRVLIVDDHAVVRQGLRALLESRPELIVAGEAADGQSALEQARALRPDVVLLDLLLPDLSGVEVTERLRAEQLPCKVLILTSSLEDRLVAAAVKAGADGYLLKATRVAELVRAIKEVAQGKRVLDPAATQALFTQLTQTDPLAELSAREREVFAAMARGRANSEIAATLQISETTIRSHAANVLEKLQLRDRTQVIIFALKHGLVRPEDMP
jgi:two-component system, NarL family, response regulator LiaR